MKISHSLLIPVVFFFSFIFLSTPVKAIPASGNFVAQKVCDMYQSKRKGTNPGNLKSQIEQEYPVVEVLKNRSNAINWVRVITSAKQSARRWISIKCGEIDDLEINPGKPDGSKNCNTSKQFDSHVLAISWQPAFCEIKGDSKKECATLHPSRFDASHFSLHGLWPNKRSCGHKYGYCSSIKKRPPTFCAYPSLNLSVEVRDALGIVMPSVKHGTCLQRHEWWKHGTCSGLDENEYYLLSMEFLDQVNSSNFVRQFVSQRIGETVNKSEFKAEFEKNFGYSSFEKVTLKCKRGMLTEMQLSLPRELNTKQKLKDLLAVPGIPDNGQGNCRHQFKIDDVKRVW